MSKKQLALLVTSNLIMMSVGGGIVGYAGTGYAIQNLGRVPTMVVGALMPLVAVGLLVPIHADRSEYGEKPWKASGLD